MTYEYKVVTQKLVVWQNRHVSGDDQTSLLNQLGIQDWELVSAVPYKDDSVTLFFKRNVVTMMQAKIERPIKIDPEDRLK